MESRAHLDFTEVADTSHGQLERPDGGAGVVDLRNRVRRSGDDRWQGANRSIGTTNFDSRLGRGIMGGTTGGLRTAERGAAGRRVAIYSQDGLGMGHLRRTNSIAAALLAADPSLTILAICDSPSGHYFQPSGRYDSLKLPTIVKRGPGDWEAPRLGASFADVHRMRTAILSAAVSTFDPDLLLVDHMPHGSMGELLPVLDLLKRQSPGSKVVLGIRDIIDAPEVVCQRWAAEGAFDAIDRYYDQVLVYGSADLYDAPTLYGFSEEILARTTFCGYIVPPRQPSSDAVNSARAALVRGDTPDTRLVVVMGGSGADAAPMMAAAVSSQSEITSAGRAPMAVICGPNMPDGDRRELARLASDRDVYLIGSVSDTSSVMAAADVVVAMAGYNSTVELIASGTPTVLVPRPGPSREQRIRARLFSERRWVEMVDPADLTPTSLAAAIDRAMDPTVDRTANGVVDLDGLGRATSELIRMLDHSQHLGVIRA